MSSSTRPSHRPTRPSAPERGPRRNVQPAGASATSGADSGAVPSSCAAPDGGGGFGSKIFVYPEEVAVAWLARKLGVPVKWTAQRSESFLSDAQGRDHVSDVEMGFDAAGKLAGAMAMRVRSRNGG